MSRIEDVLYADSLSQNPLLADSSNLHSVESSPLSEEVDKWSSSDTSSSKTLSDFMGWNTDRGANDMKKLNPTGDMESYLKDAHDSFKSKIANVVTTKKLSYLERLENLSGLRSPTARH